MRRSVLATLAVTVLACGGGDSASDQPGGAAPEGTGGTSAAGGAGHAGSVAGGGAGHGGAGGSSAKGGASGASGKGGGSGKGGADGGNSGKGGASGSSGGTGASGAGMSSGGSAGSTGTGGACNAGAAFVDGPPLVGAAPAREDAVVHPIFPRVLAARLDASFSPSSDPSAWTLASSDDPAFATPKSPIAATVKTRAAALTTNSWPYGSVPEHEVVLVFDTPTKAGSHYTLATSGGSWPFPIDPEKDWSPAIQTNQIAYLSTAPHRYAYVGYWPGDLPPLSLADSEKSYHVVDASSGATVATGQLSLRLAHDQGTEDAYNDNFSSFDVYEANLDSVTTPGSYYVVWDGVGRSTTFGVSPSAYDVPFLTVFRALYHQRCGTALDPKLTQWAHGPCHLQPTQLSTADYQMVGEDAFSALQASETGQTVQVSGGYHDAGDYDKNHSHITVTDALVDLYEIDPVRFSRDDFGIPESGNGEPDVLDEAVWGLTVWGELQDAYVDGGIPGGIGTTMYPDWTTAPDADTAPRIAYAPDPLSSYRFAGAAAKLSRALHAFDAGAEASWLDRAKKAWTWAEAHRPSYSLKSIDAYAAAELFKTTGDSAYEQAFENYGPFANGNTGFMLQNWDEDDVIPALYAYATAKNGTPNATLQTASVNVIVARAKAWVNAAQGTGYRLAKHPYAGVSTGALAIPRETGVLFRAHHLAPDDDVLAWGVYTCDYSLGANTSGTSWTTGLGPHAVKHPLHIPSLTDDIDAAVPGLTVYGPNSATMADGIYGSAVAAFSPQVGDWPIGERFVDVWYAPPVDEFTVAESIAVGTFAFGYLASLSGCPLAGAGPSPRPLP